MVGSRTLPTTRGATRSEVSGSCVCLFILYGKACPLNSSNILVVSSRSELDRLSFHPCFVLIPAIAMSCPPLGGLFAEPRRLARAHSRETSHRREHPFVLVSSTEYRMGQERLNKAYIICVLRCWKGVTDYYTVYYT